MTFIIKHRGSSDRPIIAEYMCPEHGRFELEVERPSPDKMPCPVPVGLVMPEPIRARASASDGLLSVPCGRDSPWCPSACKLKFAWATAAVKGSNDEQPSPYHMDTEALADGMDETEWRAGRDKVWENWREEEIRKTVTI